MAPWSCLMQFWENLDMLGHVKPYPTKIFASISSFLKCLSLYKNSSRSIKSFSLHYCKESCKLFGRDHFELQNESKIISQSCDLNRKSDHYFIFHFRLFPAKANGKMFQKFENQYLWGTLDSLERKQGRWEFSQKIELPQFLIPNLEFMQNIPKNY